MFGDRSDDGGKTVLKTNNEMTAAIKKAAEILNLKAHMVGRDKQELLHLCGDIEGHQVSALAFVLAVCQGVCAPVCTGGGE